MKYKERPDKVPEYDTLLTKVRYNLEPQIIISKYAFEYELTSSKFSVALSFVLM